MTIPSIPAGVDSESWTCRGCGGQMIGRRPKGDRCPDCAPGVTGPAPALTADQLVTLGQALADAVDYRQPELFVGECEDCEAHPAGLCEDHAEDLDKSDSYRALARSLGIEAEQ